VKPGRKLLHRPLAVVILVLGPLALSAACGSDDDEIVNNPPKPKPGNDASSFGGTAGVGGTGSGGTSGAGTDGSGGGSGSGTGGSAGSGTCNQDFCPENGTGTPCCVTASGPCGFDYGMGCQGGPVNDN
jgi:hypothetical protein